MAIQVTVMSLEFDSSGRKTTKVYSKNEVSLGRLPANDVVLNRPEVSAHHAKLFVKENDAGEPVLFICDLGSFNGTMLENYPLKANEEFEVRSDKRIIIGNYLIRAAYFKSGVVDEQELVEEKAESIPNPYYSLEMEKTVLEENRDQVTDGSLALAEQEISSTDERSSMTELKEDSETPIVALPNESIQAEEEQPPLTQGQAEVVEGDQPVEVNIEAQAVETTEGVADIEEVVNFDLAEFTFAVDGLDLNIDLEAKELFALKGVVVRKDSGLSDVKVELDGRELFTSADGSFDFGLFPEGTSYRLKVDRPGYLLDRNELSGVIEGPTQLSFDARKYVTISGRVTHKGTPLAGVIVDGGAIGCVTTSEDGVYSFENVPEGAEYKLSVRKSGFVFNRRSA